jgi:hypothetical protein
MPLHPMRAARLEGSVLETANYTLLRVGAHPLTMDSATNPELCHNTDPTACLSGAHPLTDASVYAVTHLNLKARWCD